jgi:hypothetical protein
MSIAKRFVKRTGALVLAMMLAVGMILTASAKNFADVGRDHDYAEQIGILSDMGVIIGTGVDEDGNALFSPEMKVNREQMALLLFRFMLNRSSAGTVNSSPFTDLVGEIYNGAISWASAAGYIIGTGPNTFNPKGGITLCDAMTMVVRALGYGSAAMDKGYPWTYINTAIRLGLDKGLEDVRYTDELTRGQIAALLYNALTAEYLIPVTTGPITFTRTSTIIEEVYGYTISECVLSATNDYAIAGSSPVVKNGYVAFTDEEGNVLTVSFAQTGLAGTPNQWLGHGVKLVYKKYDSTITVLGAFDGGKSETVTTATMGKDNAYVTIDGVNYKIVETLSDALNTNANELLVYAFGEDETLTQIKNNDEFAALLGTSAITLHFDDRNSETADRAIVTTYKFGKLSIEDGKINLADGKTEAELTGGFNNAAGAVHGNYVLFYYNPEVKALTIAEVLTPTELAFVTELTSSYAIIGGTKYTFGCESAGVQASAVASKFEAGAVVSVVAKDGMILEVIGATAPTIESTYLVAVTGTVPVYVDGHVYYALTANIDGSNVSILNTRSDIVADTVYRYVKNGAGIYTLIEYSSENFTQSGEKKELLDNSESDSNVVLKVNNNGSYRMGNTRFLTDTKTVIVVRNAGTFSVKTGKFTSEITVNAGAKAYAVFKDEVGNVETLKFLYVTDGSLGEVDASTTYVRVLGKVGAVYENNTVYTVYSVFNLKTGKVETRKSVETELEVGKDYAVGANDLILGIEGEATSTGKVRGYTAETVTIGNKVYTMTSDSVVVQLNADGTVTNVTVASLHNQEVEFVATGNTINLIFVTETDAE